MAIMALLWFSLADMGEDAAKSRAASDFWKTQRKKIKRLLREVACDLRIMSRSRYKHPKENGL